MKPCKYCASATSPKRQPHHQACLQCTRNKARWRHARAARPTLTDIELQGMFKLPPEPTTPSQRQLHVGNMDVRVRSITSKNKARREAYRAATDLAPYTARPTSPLGQEIQIT